MSPSARTNHKPFVVLSFAGLDPSGGAGLLANVQTINRHGGHALGIVTLETVQNTLGVRRVVHGDATLIQEQALAVIEDIQPDAVHIGALGSKDVVLTVGALLRHPRLTPVPLIVDTLLLSTSGAPLLADDALDAFCKDVLSIATVITPNLPEFKALAHQHGLITHDLEAALMALGAFYPGAILLKGGHLEGEPTDRLLWQGQIIRLPGHRLHSTSTHGTGCALAVSLACHLAQDKDMRAAAQAAKAYVAQAIAQAPGLGQGKGPLDLRVLVDRA